MFISFAAFVQLRLEKKCKEISIVYKYECPQIEYVFDSRCMRHCDACGKPGIIVQIANEV